MKIATAFYWLIELQSFNGRPKFYVGNGPHGPTCHGWNDPWCYDANYAIKFDSREQALRFVKSMGGQNHLNDGRIVEHGFCESAAPQWSSP